MSRPQTVDYYPAFLDLKGKKAVVVGGGKVAERKVAALLKAGAEVTVVSPSLTPRLERLKTADRILHICRPFCPADLSKSFLTIAATDSNELNERIGRMAPGLVNVVDLPEAGNFIVPSSVSRGPLSFAVSTCGVSPALSKTVRQELETLYGPEFGPYLAFLKTLRAKALKMIGDRQERERFLRAVASPEVLLMLRTGGLASVRSFLRAEFDGLAGRTRLNQRRSRS